MRIAVVGASGGFGSLAVRLIEGSDDLELYAGLGSADSLDQIAGAEVVFDATRYEVSRSVVETAQRLGIPTVVATSGWSAERIATLPATDTPLLIVPNFSLGSTISTLLARLAAPYFDTVEVVETHHAGKLDSPSGTAIRTAELIAAARSAAGRQDSVPGSGQEARGQEIAGIPVHSLRQHGVHAEQRVVLGRAGESVRIEHVTTSNESYADGILLALRKVSGMPGLTVGLDALLELPGIV